MKKVLSISLLILSASLVIGMIGYTLLNGWQAWNGDFAFKQSTFDSFADYYFTVNKGALIIAVSVALLPLCLGIYLRKN